MTEPRNRAVQVRRFGGPDGLEVVFGPPMHIAFLEMVTDPVSSMVFEAEPEERNIMRRPPRPVATPLFSPALYVITLRNGLPEDDARALTFLSLVLVNLGLLLVNRSFRASLRDLLGQRNRALVWVAAVATLMLAVILALPPSRELFHFGPLHADDLLLVATIVAGVVLVLENLKRFWRTRLAG